MAARNPPVDLVTALPSGAPAHRKRLGLVTSSRLVGRRVPLVQLFRLPALRAMAYAAGMLIPPPSFIRSRYQSVVAGYRQWWTGLE